MISTPSIPSFSLLIKPVSARCNLACEYCFYNDKSEVFPDGTSRMTFEVLEQLIRSYQALNFENKQYTYAWQGGEPTLAGLDFYKEVVMLQQKHGHGGIGVSNALQTNAVLIDDQWASFLAEYHFLTGVSLDGPEALHDFYRKDFAGGATHHRVMKAIDALRHNQAEFNILCLVNNKNGANAKAVWDFYRAHDFNYLQFIPCVEIRENGVELFTVTPEVWGEFLVNLFELWYPHRYTVSIRLFDAILAKLAYQQVVLCHLGNDCRQYFVVEHSGDVFPCDFFVNNEVHLGAIQKNAWHSLLASPTYEKFGCKKVQTAGKCRHCKYFFICQGDCLKHRMLPPLSSPQQMSYLCEGWKYFFDKTLDRFKKIAKTINPETKI